jgi:hypothetical protein
MDMGLAKFREMAANAGPARRGRKFPAEAMAIGGAYARSRREAGATWLEVGAELGVVVATAKRWAARPTALASGFHRVAVVESVPQGRYTAQVGALRVEGLELEAIVALARALS